MSNDKSAPEPVRSVPLAWWRHFRFIVYCVDAIQILGLSGFLLAILSSMGTFAMGLVEGSSITRLIPIATAMFFLVLLGSFGVADRIRGWRAAKKVDPGMTVEEFKAVIQAQRENHMLDAAWQARNHVMQSLLTQMDLWNKAQDGQLDDLKLSTGAFLGATFDKETKTEFSRAVAGADGSAGKRLVAVGVLQGVFHKLILKPIDIRRESDA